MQNNFCLTGVICIVQIIMINAGDTLWFMAKGCMAVMLSCSHKRQTCNLHICSGITCNWHNVEPAQPKRGIICITCNLYYAACISILYELPWFDQSFIYLWEFYCGQRFSCLQEKQYFEFEKVPQIWAVFKEDSIGQKIALQTIKRILNVDFEVERQLPGESKKVDWKKEGLK